MMFVIRFAALAAMFVSAYAWGGGMNPQYNPSGKWTNARSGKFWLLLGRKPRLPAIRILS